MRAEIVCGLLVRDSRALLVHRSPDREVYPGVWDFPGGHVEAGESLAGALVRELEEELGVLIEAPRGTADLVLETADYRLSVWVVRVWSGEAWNAAPDEHDDFRWVDALDAAVIPFDDPEYGELLAGVLSSTG